MTFDIDVAIMYVSGHVTAHISKNPQFTGEALAKNSKPTIYDVAEKAGVSRQTVSRVLNNRQDVSEDTRKRVKKVMAELNYQPNAIAQSLSRQKSYVFGVVVSGLKYVGPSRTLSGITNKAEELGYGLLLKELENSNSKNVIPLLRWFKSHQVDGIIWAAPEIEDNRLWLNDVYPLIDIPTIFMTMEEQKNVAIVTTDNLSGAKAAVRHLIDLGRRNIGHISGPLDWWEARQRKNGWEAAMAEANIPVNDQMWAQGNWSTKSGKAAFLELINKYPQMDAVFVGNDQMALSVLRTAQELGKVIPQDLCVVGFDGIADSEFYYPPLSTVSQNQDELGRIAVVELVSQIEQRLEGNFIVEPKYITIQPEMIIRQSSQIK
ncbi:Lactose operon repressor [bioreactor metagenome]|uniref:Lactose operon repressor n=1 Tax=bioreactor metagenome TaxID=1076179 RepID=A0A644ZBF4_9ZZZZ